MSGLTYRSKFGMTAVKIIYYLETFFDKRLFRINAIFRSHGGYI